MPNEDEFMKAYEMFTGSDEAPPQDLLDKWHINEIEHQTMVNEYLNAIKEAGFKPSIGEDGTLWINANLLDQFVIQLAGSLFEHASDEQNAPFISTLSAVIDGLRIIVDASARHAGMED